MKKNYTQPEVQIETFEIEDIITTSGDPVVEDETPNA